MEFKTDIEIAQSTPMRPITEIAQTAGVDAQYLELYGNYKAKVDYSLLKENTNPDGKLILVTAINPTPADEGKTTTTVGLADGLKKPGKNVVVALREPSLGPVFGVKGGAAGRGLFAAGGGVAVLILLLLLIMVGAIAASTFGSLFSNESSTLDIVPISAAIAQVNYGFNAQLKALQELLPAGLVLIITKATRLSSLRENNRRFPLGQQENHLQRRTLFDTLRKISLNICRKSYIIYIDTFHTGTSAICRLQKVHKADVAKEFLDADKRGGGSIMLNKKTMRVGLVICMLVVIASVCRDLNVDSILRSTTGIFLGLTRSTIYIGLFSAWGFSVRQRIVSQNVRRLLTAEAGLLVLWMLIRTVKYYFVADLNVNRMLWYFYYIPMLFVPVLAVLVSASLGKSEQARAPRWALPLALFTAILVGMVLTNDLHQFVFTFPEGTAVFTDEDYSYGTGYYFVIGWEILCALAALCIMLYKCRLPKSRKILWLPFIPTGIAVLYGVLYANGCGFIVKYAPDITVFQCLTFVAVFESCIACGLIQSNTHYVELFSISDLPLYITDRDGRIWAASKESVELPQEIQKSTEEWPVMLKDNIRLSRSGISGGYILWADNVSEISNTIKELQDINKTLNERHTLIQEENRTNQQKAHLQEANRLYHQMQMETAPQLGKMQTLIHAISKEDCREEERQLLAELIMIGAYFKRRNNLLFIAETQENIRLTELGYCFQESISALELQGVSGGCHIEGQGTVLLSESIRLYDLFESVLQETFSSLSAIAVFLRTTEDRCALCIQLHTSEAKTFHFDPQFEVEQEEECDYLLTCSIERRGGGK